MIAFAKRLIWAIRWRANIAADRAHSLIMDLIYRFQGKARRVAGRRDMQSDRQLRILFVDEMVPDPRLGAGFPRAYEMVRYLVERGDVIDHYSTSSRLADVDAIDKRFKGRVRFHRSDGARGLRRLLQTHGSLFDLILISRPVPMKAYLAIDEVNKLLKPAVVVVYDAESVFSVRESVRRALFNDPMSDAELQKMMSEELAMAASADLLLSVSEIDRDTLMTASRKPTFVVSHVVEIEASTAPFVDRSDILFIGKLAGSRIQAPNVDSVVWFVDEVMPKLDSLVDASYRLDIVGMTGPEVLEACASDRAVFHGIVDDLAPLYDHCKVFVAPTRFAAGLPLKVIETMGYGVPCVVSPLIASLLPDAARSPVLIGETPEAFAEQCRLLFTDERLWRSLSERGLRFVKDHYSRQSFDLALSEMLNVAERLRAERSVTTAIPTRNALTETNIAVSMS